MGQKPRLQGSVEWFTGYKNSPGLTRRYHQALFVIGFICLLNYVAFQILLGQERNYADLINISGAQRMLSQRIAFLTERLTATPTDIALRMKLAEAIDRMATSHQRLLQESAMVSNIRDLYLTPPMAVDQQTRNFLLSARTLAQTPYADTEHLPLLREAATGPLLVALDTVVSAFEEQSHIERNEITRIENTLLAVLRRFPKNSTPP